MTPMERIVAYSSKDNDENPDPAWADACEYRHEEIRAELPVPFCCPKVAGVRVVQPQASEKDPYQRERPFWASLYNSQGMKFLTRVEYCPFCGDPLPKLTAKSTETAPPKVCRHDGNYCRVCAERLDHCLCSHPFSLWEPYKAPKIEVALGLLSRPSGPLNVEYLSVSRKNDTSKKGLSGGKLDPGETPVEAMIREIREETGLRVIDYHLVFDAVDDLHTRCQTFRVTRFEGEVETKESGLVEWTQAKTLAHSNCSPFHEYNHALFTLLGAL